MNDRDVSHQSPTLDNESNAESSQPAPRLPYSSPEILDIGSGTGLTGWSSAGPFHDGSSEQGRSWKQ
ncbi:MAG: hypothetical protein KF785_15210 [Gemmatimonadales bacterium]|nr:hypothetical protein [Gemmatimonadales bacterium]